MTAMTVTTAPRDDPTLGQPVWDDAAWADLVTAAGQHGRVPAPDH